MKGPGGRGGRPVILHRYILREFAVSFLVAFLFFFVVFFVNQILLLAEDILSKKAPLGAVLRLLLYAIPSEVALSFPFAALVGALMAAARLSADSEFLVMQASGLPPRRLFLPFAVLGLAITVGSFFINEYFLPLGAIEYGKLFRSLVVSTPAVELQPWTSRRYKSVTIVTGAVTADAVEDVLIFDKAEAGRDRIISARTARLVGEADGAVVLHLEGVWAQTQAKAGEDRVEYSAAASMEYRIEASTGPGSSSTMGPYEMSSLDLGRVIAAKRAALAEREAGRKLEVLDRREALADLYGRTLEEGLAPANAAGRFRPALERVREAVNRGIVDRSISIYRTEYYKKFAIPAGAVCFVLLAFPLGLKARRAGRAVGFGLGLLVAVAYWALLLVGSTMSTRLSLSPFWAMWAPNLIMATLGAGLWLKERLVR